MDEFAFVIRQQKDGKSDLVGVFSSEGMARKRLAELYEEKIGQKRYSKIVLEEFALTCYEPHRKIVFTLEPF